MGLLPFPHFPFNLPSLREALPTGAILMHRAVSPWAQGALRCSPGLDGPHLPHCHTPPWPRPPPLCC